MYTDIKTFEDACAKLNILPEEFKITYPDSLTHPLGKALVAHAKLVIIAQALNDGWVPDWSNGDWKYYPWFKFNDASAVGGFSFIGYDNAHSYSPVGSRLCYKSREIAEYAGTQFLDLYRDYMVIQ